MSMFKQAVVAVTGLALAVPLSYADDVMHIDARVLSVIPVYEQASVPRQECWEAPALQPSNNTGGAVLGAVVGGLLGSTVGGGNGKVAAAAIGAATGAVVGDRSGGYQEGQVERCRTVYVNRDQRAGYDVTYQFHGATFTTRLSYDPGNRLPLTVRLHPEGGEALP